MPRSPPLSYGDGWITENPLGPSQSDSDGDPALCEDRAVDACDARHVGIFDSQPSSSAPLDKLIPSRVLENRIIESLGLGMADERRNFADDTHKAAPQIVIRQILELHRQLLRNLAATVWFYLLLLFYYWKQSIVRCGLSCLVDLNSDLYYLCSSLHGLHTFWAWGLSWINKETTTTTTTAV